jgi:hypothetical protein
MIIVKLQGGLGNQMFQYAAAKALAIKYSCALLLDLSFLEQRATQITEGFTNRQYELGIFNNIAQNFVDDVVRKQFTVVSQKKQWLQRLGFSYPKIYIEPSFEFNENLFKQKPPVLLEGYWQSEQYFIKEAAAIKKAFSFPALVAMDENNAVLSAISAGCSVAVHVRRADYLHPAIAAQHGTCSEAYYKEAIQNIQSSFPSAIFYFFSDDAAWVKKTFTDHLPKAVLVKNNTGANSWKDMYLMSKCRHQIIANSSFSWWGAWLNDEPGKIVIAPKRWFADTKRNEATGDLIPANWMRL